MNELFIFLIKLLIINHITIFSQTNCTSWSNPSKPLKSYKNLVNTHKINNNFLHPIKCRFKKKILTKKRVSSTQKMKEIK